jgi:predicted RNase H-like nuclease (RuvC/YqgF family)
MTNNQPIIIGIDPGTTAAYSAVSIGGEIIRTTSKRGLDFPTLINEIYSIGTPIAVAADKKKTPSMVQRFAAKTGAKIIAPDLDMSTAEKQEMVKGQKYSNMHEADSLASALFAYKKVAGTIKKVKQKLSAIDRPDLMGDVLRLMMIDETIAVSAAIGVFLEEHKKKNNESQKKTVKKDYKALYSHITTKYLEQKSENLELKKKLSLANKHKKKEMRKIAALKSDLSKRREPEKKEKIISSKERDFSGLRARFDKYSENCRKKIEDYQILLSRLNTGILVKIINDLGKSEFAAKKKKLNLRKGDIVYIRNPAIVSLPAAEELRGLCDVVITKTRPKEISKNFILLDHKECRLFEAGDYAVIRRSVFNMLLEQKKILSKVLADYQKERSMD